MSLHDTAEFSKKFGIVSGLGLGAILTIVIFVKVGEFIHSVLVPPRIPPPNETYGKLPQISFPQSTVNGEFTYSINTVNGSLPTTFPDRINIYPMILSQGNYEDLPDAQKAVQALGFTDPTGNLLPDIALGGPNYEWRESAPDSTGYQKTIVYNTVTQNFTMTSDYLTSLTALTAQSLGDQNEAISTVQNFLSNVNQSPTDVDYTITQNPTTNETYATAPELFSITSGQLAPTTSLSNAQIIRVDLYQKEIDYTLNAGLTANASGFSKFNMTMPILYPHPPYSTMNFLIASSQGQPTVVSAEFNHQYANTTITPANQATYPIKTAQEAYDDLKNGKGYVAAYTGSGSQILISNVFLAYYIGETQQSYLMPIIVFTGQNGFFAYVSAVSDVAVQ
jgi:hypothetical protein